MLQGKVIKILDANTGVLQDTKTNQNIKFNYNPNSGIGIDDIVSYNVFNGFAIDVVKTSASVASSTQSQQSTTSDTSTSQSTQDEPSLNPNLIKCPDCGHIVSKNATACPSCGNTDLTPKGLEALHQKGGIEGFMGFIAMTIISWFICVFVWGAFYYLGESANSDIIQYIAHFAFLVALYFSTKANLQYYPKGHKLHFLGYALPAIYFVQGIVMIVIPIIRYGY